MIKIDDDLSPNGCIITRDEPKSSGDDGRLNHYTSKIREYGYNEYPLEWALSHYSLAYIYLADRAGNIFNNSSNKKSQAIKEGRAKCIETSLYHFDKCMEVFKYQTHPNIWALCGLMMGQVK